MKKKWYQNLWLTIVAPLLVAILILTPIVNAIIFPQSKTDTTSKVHQQVNIDDSSKVNSQQINGNNNTQIQQNGNGNKVELDKNYPKVDNKE